MTTDPRIEAVAQALAAGWLNDPAGESERTLARVAVAALDAYDREHYSLKARALFEATVRESIAQAIERGIDGRTGPAVQAWDEALRRAARIARGTT